MASGVSISERSAQAEVDEDDGEAERRANQKVAGLDILVNKAAGVQCFNAVQH
jgi:hypothetical protein